ncbi:SulP family inorganic anion transporter [Rhodococcus sp. D2-41]|uniref:SulP family inorganic anion transporter n=1 Tax=Speluncibacter jeojiensis TaxID=2710754 RepID=A0A9X4RF97_9ACTN|nr:SulP family inorganic anion transporter [Rhodococcus sp. D2-41]MDG3009474.1 SulP family inorganic anion transporter [Rhodococcus sp. D2-41]MDG3016403.1 SulP family inorganic anion transporter [Corynebacteriales bacterium D3-21]
MRNNTIGRLTQAAGQWCRGRLPERRHFRRDLVAGLPGAISSVPDGMACGLLAGVNPVNGLYASFAGRTFGSLPTGTKLMVVATTSAAALAAGSGLAGVPEPDRARALGLLTLLAGVIMLVAAALKLGRYTRFVSHSVMTGFLTGVSLNIVFGQLPDLVGAKASGSVAATKALDLVTHPGRIDLSSLLTGVITLAVLIGLMRTRFALIGSLAALVASTMVVIGFGLDSVRRVSDVGTIPRGIPLPGIPDLTLLTPSLLASAAAVAVIVLVQGAGVAEVAPNPDGSRSMPNQDFAGQGVGNIASALFGGQPVGGSVGQTAVNVTAGAKSRWGGVLSGLWMVLILIAFSGLVGKVPMPTLAAILIFAAIGSIRLGTITTILRSGSTSVIALVTTLVATLALPVSAAVGIGVALSLLLQLNQEAMDLRLVRLIPEAEHDFREVRAPKHLRDGDIVILDVYGSLFYAGSRTLQVMLPDPDGAEAPEVILRLRGRTTLGATFFAVLLDYADRLERTGGRLYLTGLSKDLAEYWNEERLQGLGLSVHTFNATALLGESTRQALQDAQTHQIVRE